MFKIRFKQNNIASWADKYIEAMRKKDRKEEERIRKVLVPKIRKRGYLKKQDLIEICDWKTRRRAHKHYKKNSPKFIKEVTKLMFSTKEERLRIEILTLLDGVRWPVASAILHFVFPKKYPILDFRALWSLSVAVPNKYTYDFWQDYCDCCRKLAKGNKVDLRTLDRALWKYSKAYPPPKQG